MLDESTKKQYLQQRQPNYLIPDNRIYYNYIHEIINYSLAHKDEEILSIQLFACHGAVVDGCQVAVINKFDEKIQFYEQIEVEKFLRQLKADKDVSNIYFLVLFACCRESFIPGKKTGVKNKEIKDGMTFAYRGAVGVSDVVVELDGSSNETFLNSRGTLDLGITNAKISNFTFVFGCDPAAGVKADTKFVKLFIEHLKGLFNPEDGSVLIPDCLGTIDSIKENVNFESTSSNLGRTLQLFR